MDHFSCLGPIDPQIPKDNKWIPATSYLEEYDRIVKAAEDDKLTSPDVILLEKLDLGELYQFRQVRELAVELLENWLAKYKFRNWNETETRKEAVTDDMKRQRAKEIAEALNNPNRWHVHGRFINKQVLENELNLLIDELSPEKWKLVREYTDLIMDYMQQVELVNFVNAKGYF